MISIAKESENLGAKKVDKDIFVDVGLNLIGKTIKNELHQLRVLD